MTGFEKQHIALIVQLHDAEDRIVKLETAIREAIGSLERVYGGLPGDRYPGPPTTIIQNLQTALGR